MSDTPLLPGLEEQPRTSRCRPEHSSRRAADMTSRLRALDGRRVLVSTGVLARAEIAELARLSEDGEPIEVRLRIATRDRRLAAVVEPSAPAPGVRLASLRTARRVGLVAGIVLAPLIPGVTAHEADLVALLADARAAGASFVDFEVRFLDPVRAAAMLRTLRRHYPRVAARYEVWMRTAARPPCEERLRIEALVARIADRSGLPLRGGRSGLPLRGGRSGLPLRGGRLHDDPEDDPTRPASADADTHDPQRRFSFAV